MKRAVIPVVLMLCSVVFAQPPDEHTMAYWKLDEGSGDFVEDSSANGNHGTVEGAVWTTDAKTGGAALEFNGPNTQVVVPDSPSLHPSTGNITIGAWVKVFSNPKSWPIGGSIVYKQDAYQWVVNTNGALWLGVWGSRLETIGSFDFEDHVNEWHHCAVTYDNAAQHAVIYVDGELNIEGTVGDSIGQTTNDLYFGNKVDDGGWLFGILDEVRISDIVRTQDEIEASMLGGARYPFASQPDPPDGMIYENTWVNLRWKSGDFAVTHDVYMGENFNDVNEATRDSDVFRGNQVTNFMVAGFPGFAYPNGLAPGTNYYWRIDEVNDANVASPWKGETWSFFVPPREAYEPTPADNAKFVDTDVTLSWKPGYAAKLHHVYFGETYEEVDSATGAPTHTSTTYTPPGPLENDKTYYWRVDEFDGATVHKGHVWTFSTLPIIELAADPNLIAWWTFDEASGDVALDWSGHGNHGVLFGPSWVTPGIIGEGALNFTGSSRVAIKNLTYEGSDYREVTLATWLRTTIWNDQYIASFDRDQYWRMSINVNGSGPGHVGWHVMTSNGQVDLGGNTRVDNGAWHHACGVFDNGQVLLYIDGELDASASGGSTFGTGNVRYGLLGANCEATTFNGLTGIGSPIAGDIDDMRIYDRALTADEIIDVMRGDPLVAWDPSPSDGSTPDVDTALPLSWSPGEMAASHDVYFGLDRDAVKEADATDTTGIYRGNQTATTFTPPEGVEWGGGPYYWRIDESNTDGTISKGNVWTFTVADFILVDDFESYTDNDAAGEAIWQHWIDGFGIADNGAQVGNLLPPYAEQTIVHSGSQSMPLMYDNTAGVTNSEAALTLTAPRDWTRHSLASLSLWTRGYPASVGSFVEAPAGTYTMTASGADISGNADEFHFVFKTLTGAGSITARVNSIQDTNPWAKAGVMIRETLDAGSKHALACVTPGSGVASEGRTTRDGASYSTNETGITAPHWVKLERDASGNFTVSHSTNGTSWQSVASSIPTNIPMTSNVYIGLALTSHDATQTCQAVFSNVTTTGNVSGQWTHQDVGITTNAAEPMYVALSNADGASAVVANDDPAAATIDEWTEWVISLQAFADQGINLADVDSIAVGLGTKADGAAPGGAGTVYYDDIRLYPQQP